MTHTHIKIGNRVVSRDCTDPVTIQYGPQPHQRVVVQWDAREYEVKVSMSPQNEPLRKRLPSPRA